LPPLLVVLLLLLLGVVRDYLLMLAVLQAAFG
jgi:hypothetical protein